MKDTTATTTWGDGKALTIDDLIRATAELEKMPKNDEWLLIDPFGRVYKGKPEVLFPVIAMAHPLFKIMPFTPTEEYKP